MYGCGQVLAGQGVLDQAGGHTDSCQTKADVETSGGPAPTGQNRAEERTGVNADVEDGESGVAAVIAILVERTNQHGGVALQPAGTNRNQQEADDDARRPCPCLGPGRPCLRCSTGSRS